MQVLCTDVLVCVAADCLEGDAWAAVGAAHLQSKIASQCMVHQGGPEQKTCTKMPQSVQVRIARVVDCAPADLLLHAPVWTAAV